MAIEIMQMRNPTGSSLPLRYAKGHFATNHSHINYYVDLTLTKHRLSEARKAAVELTEQFKSSTIVDTILCLDGTEVVGACMASQLTASGFMNLNAHQTIYVVTPEHSIGSQLLFRDNVVPMIYGKHIDRSPELLRRDRGRCQLYFLLCQRMHGLSCRLGLQYGTSERLCEYASE